MNLARREKTNDFKKRNRGRTIKLNSHWLPVFEGKDGAQRGINEPECRLALALILENIGEFIIE